MKGKRADIPDAIRRLQESGVPVVERAYGFALEHPEWRETRRYFGECGCEHDGSISLVVHADELPPIVRFFRFSFVEVADLVEAAYGRVPPDAASETIVAALRAVDATYDHDDLDRRLEQWQQEFERFWSSHQPPT